MNDTRWDETLKILSGQMTKSAFESNFSGSTATLTNGNLIIFPASKFAFERIKNRLMPMIKRVVGSVYGDTVKIALQENFTTLEPEPEPLPSVPQSTLETTGFTPVVDSLAQEIGLIPAAIYGVVWRYCQMNSRTCYATQKTVAGRLGLNRMTVNKHLKTLLNDGYIRCLNENENGKSKVYIVTNKVTIKAGFSIEATVNGQV